MGKIKGIYYIAPREHFLIVWHIIFLSNINMKNLYRKAVKLNMTDCSEVAARAEALGCRVFFNQPLRQYTTFKIGGECSLLVEINSEDSCTELISMAEKLGIPYFILGKGSNLLVDDSGFDGIAFRMGSDFEKISVMDNGVISCTAGTSLSSLCRFALEKELAGLEFAWGIPGTVGGAVYMNAGAYGGEIKDIILSVSYSDKNGVIHLLNKDELELSYRHSVFMDSDKVILSAEFKLNRGNPTEIRAKMDELMLKRREKQPLEYPSAGSTFKRPDGTFAGLLIEQCGLKGKSIGGAEVSQKHSGFIINKGNATFSDVMELISIVQNEVFEKTGYRLECEPRIISSEK